MRRPRSCVAIRARCLSLNSESSSIEKFASLFASMMLVMAHCASCLSRGGSQTAEMFSVMISTSMAAPSVLVCVLVHRRAVACCTIRRSSSSALMDSDADELLEAEMSSGSLPDVLREAASSSDPELWSPLQPCDCGRASVLFCGFH